MSRIECSECHDLIDTTARTVVLPFVCDGCKNDAELLVAMAPGLKVEESDNVACGCTPTDEATSLLIEDQANQLALAKNEVEALRQVNGYLEVRELALTNQNTQLHQNIDVLLAQKEKLQKSVENLVAKNFLKEEKNEKLAESYVKAMFETFFLKIANSKQTSIIQQLRRELAYAAKRLFELAVEVGAAEKSRDVWQKRAEIAKRAYDRASADRRAYREELKALKAARG